MTQTLTSCIRTSLLCCILAISSCSVPRMAVSDDGNSLTVMSGDRKVLSYRYTLSEVPEGVREIYRRSGYIHPAYTPSGFIITGIQPEGHRHHYGIWNPWTRLEYDGKLYDLWNLKDSLGTVRARSVERIIEEREVAGFDALLDHVIFSPEGEKTVMNERLEIRVHSCKDGNLWDFTSHITPCTELPITLRAHRYQGLCLRGNAGWGADNVEMQSSEGLGRDSIEDTRAKWIYLNARNTGADGKTFMNGVLIMSSPDNHDAPQTVRNWSSTQHKGKDNVFINFCPAKFSDWILEPGKTQILRYRFFVYDGTMTAEKAEKMWKEFAN